MLFLFAIVVGIVLGLVVGGRVGNLALLKFRWPWVILLAVVVRTATQLPPLSRVEGAQYLYMLTLAVIVGWTIWHWDRLPGIWLVSAGSALNLLVIGVNGGRMPVAAEFAGSLLRHGNEGQYTVMGHGTQLNFLADWISLWPSPEVYSPGDLLIGLGLAIAVFISTATPTRIVN